MHQKNILSFMNQLSCHLRYALIVIAAVVLIIMLSRWTGKTNFKPTTPTTSSSRVDVKTVVDEAAAANQAAHSSTNTLDALLDVTTAIATLNTATTLAGKEPVTNAAGVSLRTLEQEMGAHQRQLIMQLQQPAPQQHPTSPPTLQPLPKI
jgi:flagellar biosynthesis/type III secretory pathway M-ring protein FliF/YscJ